MLYFVALCFCIGVSLSFFVAAIEPVAIVLLVLVFVYGILRIILKKKIYGQAFLCCLFMLFGIVRADYAQVGMQNASLQHLENHFVVLDGYVSIPPKLTSKGMSFEFKTESGESILVRYEGYEDFLYGDVLKVKGVLERPEPFETIGGTEFNYPMYLAKDGISFLIQKARIEKTGSGGGNSTLSFLYSAKNLFIEKMKSVLSVGDTALMSGILLGAQDAISQNVQDAFRKAGLTHIMVLSGYNITVVGEAVARIVNIWFSKFVSLGFGGFAIILFALLSGGGASTVRSTIMALIAILGKILGREYDAFRALILVALCMVLWNPFTLLYDPSFHLSFLATAGMILLSKRIEVKLMKIKWDPLREIVSTTLATQVCVAPYFLIKMGSVSIISLISNIFVLPVVPLTMFFGFCTGVFGFISPYLAFAPGLVSHVLLLYITKAAELFASLPFSTFSF